MAKFEFNLSAKKNESGKSQVMARIYFKPGVQFRVKTGIYVNPDYFKHGEIVVPTRGKFDEAERKQGNEDKKALNQYKTDVEMFASIADGRIEITAEWLTNVLRLHNANLIKRNEDGKYTFRAIEDAINSGDDIQATKDDIYSLIDKYRIAANLGERRVKIYDVFKRILFRYELYKKIVEKCKDFSIDIDTMMPDDIEAFRDFARNEGDLMDENPDEYKSIIQTANERFKIKRERCQISNRSENYLVMLLKEFRAVYNWLNNTNRTTNDPFRNGKVKIGREQYGKPIFLSMEERDRLASFDLSSRPSLEIQRDIFIFQCFAGCRVGDLMRLTASNIDENGILEYIPSKTKDGRDEDGNAIQPRVPLSAQALAIVEKYKGKDEKGRLFPFIAPQNYNEAIKEALKIAGFTHIVVTYDAATNKEIHTEFYKVASSHMARRTFCGIGYKLTKDPNIIGTMSGHVRGSKAFARYHNIDDDDRREVIRKMSGQTE